MGSDQANEANDPGKRNGNGSDQRDQPQRDAFEPFNRYPHRCRCFLACIHGIEVPRHTQQNPNAHSQKRHEYQNRLPIRTPKSAHQPTFQVLQSLRSGDIFQHRYSRRKKTVDRSSNKNENAHITAAHLGHSRNKQQAYHTKHKGIHRYKRISGKQKILLQNAYAQHHCQCRAKRSAAGYPHGERACQWIAKQRLHHTSTHPQRYSGEHAQYDTRQAHLRQYICLRRIFPCTLGAQPQCLSQNRKHRYTDRPHTQTYQHCRQQHQRHTGNGRTGFTVHCTSWAE